MIPRPKTALLLAVLVALSGCTVIGANGTPTTQPGTFVDTIQGQSPTPSASPSPSPSPPTTQSPSPSPTRSPTPTPTPPPTADDMTYPGVETCGTQTRADCEAFLRTLDEAGIDVTHFEAADTVWMVEYDTDAASWDEFADEMETIAVAWCEYGHDDSFFGATYPDGSSAEWTIWTPAPCSDRQGLMAHVFETVEHNAD